MHSVPSDCPNSGTSRVESVSSRPSKPRAWNQCGTHEVRAPQQKSFGEVPEWSNGADSKSVDRVIGPGVRIPPSPPYTKEPASAGFFVYGGEGSPMRTPGFDNLAQRDWTPQRSEGAPQGRENATSVFESIPRWSLVRSREVAAGFFVYGGEGSPMRTPGFDNLAQRDWTPQRSEGAPQGRENAQAFSSQSLGGRSSGHGKSQRAFSCMAERDRR